MNKRETATFCFSPPDNMIPSLEKCLVTSVSKVASHLFRIPLIAALAKQHKEAVSSNSLYADKLSLKDNAYIGDS